ncbi:MAG: endolytic transglycosylase MltG [Candidatus Paceibacterota bacterium]
MIQKEEILISIVVAVVVLLIFQLPLSRKAEQEKFVVELNASQSELTNKLVEEDFVNNESAFEFWLSVWPGEVTPGSYILSKEMSSIELVDKLTGKPRKVWVQIPEGLRKEQIAEELQEKLNWNEMNKENFQKEAREGHLFPDTYLLKENYSGKEVAKRMHNHFNEKIEGLFDEAQKQNIRNDTLMVLASIVQREAANKEQMPLIAGIIWNRWLNERPFEIDATLQYALGEQGNWWPQVKPKHKEIDSPYNTYKYEGRPPAPICNPGLAAIRAVIFPEETDYFYYLHDKQEQIHLAKTKQQHWQNIDRYLRFPWVYKQKKLYKLEKDEINSILEKLKEKYPDKDRRLEALSLLRLGTPYQRGCLGEESERDKDPIFQLETTDCTAFVLTNTALLYSKSFQQAENEMKKVNYRNEISFEDRLHFTTDRIKVSPYFEPITEQVTKESKIKTQRVTLNKIKQDGERLIDIDWQKQATVKYIPRQHVDEELLSSLPQSAGVAFVNEEMFELGLDVMHEGFLLDQRYLIHASSEREKVVKVNFLNYFQNTNFDGITVYKIK